MIDEEVRTTSRSKGQGLAPLMVYTIIIPYFPSNARVTRVGQGAKAILKKQVYALAFMSCDS